MRDGTLIPALSSIHLHPHWHGISSTSLRHHCHAKDHVQSRHKENPHCMSQRYQEIARGRMDLGRVCDAGVCRTQDHQESPGKGEERNIDYHGNNLHWLECFFRQIDLCKRLTTCDVLQRRSRMIGFLGVLERLRLEGVSWECVEWPRSTSSWEDNNGVDGRSSFEVTPSSVLGISVWEWVGSCAQPQLVFCGLMIRSSSVKVAYMEDSRVEAERGDCEGAGKGADGWVSSRWGVFRAFCLRSPSLWSCFTRRGFLASRFGSSTWFGAFNTSCAFDGGSVSRNVSVSSWIVSRLSSTWSPPVFTDTSPAERFRLVEDVELETIVEVRCEDKRWARGEGGTFVGGVDDSEDSISGELSCFVISG